jgi:hypothetical protein
MYAAHQSLFLTFSCGNSSDTIKYIFCEISEQFEFLSLFTIPRKILDNYSDGTLL